MKNNLWTFGDSLTAPYSVDYDWSRDYIDWKGYTPKVYGDIISDKLNLNLINLGVGGFDNYSIFQTFCDVSNKIKSGDTVIFGWSSTARFRLVTDTESWTSLIPNTKNHWLNNYVSEKTIKEILANRDCFRYAEEVNSWIKLINNYLKDNDKIHWTAFDYRINSVYIRGLETIENETNGKIDDKHFSEKGQYDLSNILLNKIGKKFNKFL